MRILSSDSRRRALLAVLMAASVACPAAAPVGAEPVAPDSPRWFLEGAAKVGDYLGRRSIRLDGGGATLKDFELRDGVIDVDVATPASRGFFGVQFRISADGNNGEWVYLRQHKSGLPDALQYTPVLGTGLNWQIYNGAGFTGPMEIPRSRWFHLRLELTGAQARLYADDMNTPVLVMPDLKSGIPTGQIALAVLQGETLLELQRARDAGCGLGAPAAADAGGHADALASVALVRRPGAQSRAPAVGVREQGDALAGRRGRSARVRRHQPLP
ncbi:MAG TPA: hypothetical protein VGQ37_11365 [Vicinamibacterales bacterium]|jgi:hypothetical protein|nr:hypothetical protein [Vicinamibacterales bacterium]